MEFLDKFAKEQTLEKVDKKKKETKVSIPKPLLSNYDEYIKFNHTKNVIITSGIYKGYLAFVYNSEPKMYEINISGVRKNIKIKREDFRKKKKEPEQVLIINKRNKHYGKTGKIVKTIAGKYVLYINAIGRQTQYNTKITDGKYSQEKFDKKDLFFMDVVLQNDNYFQVKKVLKNGNFVGYEKNETGRLLYREISQAEIKEFSKGFSVFGTIGEDFSEVDENMQIEKELLEEQDEEQEFVSSYKDVERIAFTGENMTNKQKQIKNNINKIFELFSLPQSNNIFKLISDIESANKLLKEKLSEKGIQLQIKTDEKFIIGVLTYYFLLEQNIYNIEYENYVSSLIDKKIIRATPNTKSVFLIPDWSDTFSVKRENLDLLTPNQLARLIFSNCDKFLSFWFDKTADQQIKSPELELIPLGKVEKQEIYPVTITSIVRQESIPDETKNIIWSEPYISILKNYKRELLEKLKNKTRKSTQDVYKFVYDNLQNGILILNKLSKEIEKESDKEKSKILTRNQKYLEKYWNEVFSLVKDQYEIEKKNKDLKIKKLQEQKTEDLKRRETAIERKRLTRRLEEIDISDSDKNAKEKIPESPRKKIKTDSVLGKLRDQSRLELKNEIHEDKESDQEESLEREQEQESQDEYMYEFEDIDEESENEDQDKFKNKNKHKNKYTEEDSYGIKYDESENNSSDELEYIYSSD